MSSSRPSSTSLPWIALAAFVVATALRFELGGGEDATATLYAIPIALLALARGAVGGVAGTAVAMWLLAGSIYVSDELRFTVLGFLSRSTALLVAGVVLGGVVDQRDAARRAVAAEKTRSARLHEHGSSIDAECADALTTLLDAKRALDRNDPERALFVLGSAAPASVLVRLVSGSVREPHLDPE